MKNKDVTSSMRSIQIICFVIIVMSIYGIFIDSSRYYSCIQALQYSIPAGYMLIEAFIFNQNMYDSNDKDNNSMSEDLIQ